MKSFFLLLSIAFSLTAGQSCSANYFWNGQRCVLCSVAYGECTDMNSITKCIDGYYLDPSSSVQVCKKCPTNCTVCEYLGYGMDVICSSCADTFSVVSGTCQYLEQCLIINLSLGSCIQCEDGYYLSNEQKCVLCNNSCGTCLNDMTCLTCKDNYSFLGDSFYCTKCAITGGTDGCKSCKTATSGELICLGCIDGYYMNDSSICVACPSNCISCVLGSDNTPKCYQCDLTTDQDQEGNCHSCSETVPNCAYCTVENFQQVCQNCKPGYYLASRNTCTICSSPIKECSCVDSDCTKGKTTIQCIDGYNLVDGQCIMSNQCALYSSSSQCEICSTGYYLSGATCLQSSIPNCAVYVLNKNECSVCSAKYYLSSSTQCTSFETGCQAQSQANSCDIYLPYYYQYQGVIKECKSSSISDTCAYLEQSTGTITCQEFKFPYSMDCSLSVFDPSQSGCLVWQSVATGKCALCDSSKQFYLQASTGKCAHYQTNCSSFNTTSEECISCSILSDQFYAVSLGKCLLCADQTSGHFTCLDNIASDSNTMQKNSAFLKKPFTVIIGLIYLAQIL